MNLKKRYLMSEEETPNNLDSDVSMEALQKLSCSIAELLLGDLEQAQKVACDVMSTIEAKIRNAKEDPDVAEQPPSSKQEWEELVHNLSYQFSLKRLAGIITSPVQ